MNTNVAMIIFTSVLVIGGSVAVELGSFHVT